MPRAVASAMPGEDEPAHVVTKREACHESAKLERCRSPLRVSYVVFFFCSLCKRLYRNHHQGTSALHPRNNAHNASTPRSARLKAATHSK